MFSIRTTALNISVSMIESVRLSAELMREADTVKAVRDEVITTEADFADSFNTTRFVINSAELREVPKVLLYVRAKLTAPMIIAAEKKAMDFASPAIFLR